MRLFRRLCLFALVALLLLVAAVLALRFWPGETPSIDGPLEVLAHRGVHQTFPLDDLDDDTCTARLINPVAHEYIENTLPSIRAAFEAGATMVEIDVHHTSDGHVVVFHDWTLECRTDGRGVTQEQPLAYLKGLDVGYGYTADGGKTFPLRGKGIGAMPTLEQVLDAFPDRRFILHQKSASRRTVEAMATVLSRRSAEQRARLFYWGSLHRELSTLVPGLALPVFDRGGIKACGVAYLKSGGLGQFPGACAGGVLLLPAWAVKYLWGWPDRFVGKAQEAGSRIVVAEVDSIEEAGRFSAAPLHGVMTNRIELVGPWLRARRAAARPTCASMPPFRVAALCRSRNR